MPKVHTNQSFHPRYQALPGNVHTEGFAFPVSPGGAWEQEGRAALSGSASQHQCPQAEPGNKNDAEPGNKNEAERGDKKEGLRSPPAGKYEVLPLSSADEEQALPTYPADWTAPEVPTNQSLQPSLPGSAW